MAGLFDRVDGFLGRLVFRAAGLMCLLISLACIYAAWWHVERREAVEWLWPLILFGLSALAVAAVVPDCFSSRRSLIEALDAMESDVPDMQRRSGDAGRKP